MPKMTSTFTEPLNTMVEPTMKQKLKAIGYMMGNGGKFADVTRYFLTLGIRQYEANLSPEQKEAYEETLNNVRLAHEFKPTGDTHE